ncbi:hypothetical protein V9K92_01260 [Phyllobacterium sp. CCNWLW109]
MSKLAHRRRSQSQSRVAGVLRRDLSALVEPCRDQDGKFRFNLLEDA